MMERRIPNELVDCILENLYFDRHTLLNCALVGRAWVRSSQRGIFREIVLHLPSGFAPPIIDAYLKAPTFLHALFLEKPYLASYVRTLELQSFAHAATPVYTATASLVQRLSEVKKLIFHFVEWKSLPPLLKAVLTEICKAPSVTHFCAIQFELPTFAELASLLSGMKNLKVLDASVVCEDSKVPNSLPESEMKPRHIQLSDLRFTSSFLPFTTWFQQDWCPFEVGNLNSLEITSEVDIVTLQYFGTNLRQLKLRQTRPYAGLELDLAHLGCTPNLRNLSLMSSCENNPDVWIWVLFSPLLDGNLFPLQHLTIGLLIRHSQSNLLQPHHWKSWASIDALLAKPEFASLKTVDFKLIAARGYHIPGGVGKSLSEKLPFLEGSGKLVVHIMND
ncbi:hypothetical protein BT96DRAFT_1013544 [Gymnopus androsaceus JB14]|uniref:F-box domain-containing protein n=1 Tax=Gymnopus androsaceus JB14 TaxID=1447944 RepID=A0A6A4I7R2_9AGAR|nr:hypothetical protein BT96DRAFT_1013544 [Gymnopus androsaceus JB14]